MKIMGHDYQLTFSREQEQLMIQQSKLASMGEMIGAIAHQWRQPLNALGLNIQDLLDANQHGELDEAYLKDLVARSMKQINYMSTTIDDFRNYFKPDKEKVFFNIQQPVTTTINLIKDNFEHHRIAIEVNMADDPVICGYPHEFAQVLLNILNNARDAVVERKVSNPRISIFTGRENGKTFVTITDNGGGITENIINRIFEPYFSTKEPDKGTGIGLFMSKTIIEKNMGGKLVARNTTDGAEFRIEV